MAETSRSHSNWTALAVCLAPVFCAGCLFLPGREALERLLDERGTPYAETRFSAAPAAGERPLSELRASLEYWSAGGAGGRPRWHGVLAPEPEDLYLRLVRLIDAGARSVTLVAYRFDALGLDDATLVDYLDAEGERVGFDHVVYGKAASPRRAGEYFAGYGDLAWWEVPQLLLDVPVYLAIGLKELAGEIVKSPLSFFDSAVFGPLSEKRSLASPVSLERGAMAVVEDWRNGLTGLTWRLRARARHTPLDLARDLAGAVPIVGPLFDHRSPPQSTEPPRAARLVVVSQGIHAGDETEQFVEAWRRRIEALRPEATVVCAPYRYGGVFDVMWSVLNVSHGFGYDLAERVVFAEGVGPGDAVDLVSFSGGVQRSVAATRALRHAGVRVPRLSGVAGPAVGSSCAALSTVLLSEELFGDPVVLTARLIDGLYVFLPSNIAVSFVEDAGGHHTPYFPNGLTRAPESGYGERLAEILRE